MTGHGYGAQQGHRENECTHAPERSLKPHVVSSWIQQHNEKIRLELLLLATYFLHTIDTQFFEPRDHGNIVVGAGSCSLW